MNQIEQLKADLGRRFPGLEMEIDPPADEVRGTWHMDIRRLGATPLVVEWRPGRGFGVSSLEDESGYGDYGVGPDEVYTSMKDAYDRVLRLVLSDGKTEPPEAVRLAELRQIRGLTQSELAENVGVKQANISRIEGRGEDVKVSTLTRIVASLGARLVFIARFPDGTQKVLDITGKEPEISKIESV